MCILHIKELQLGNRDTSRHATIFNEECQVIKHQQFDRMVMCNDDNNQIIVATSWKNSLEKKIAKLKRDFNFYFYRGLSKNHTRIDKKY